MIFRTYLRLKSDREGSSIYIAFADGTARESLLEPIGRDELISETNIALCLFIIERSLLGISVLYIPGQRISLCKGFAVSSFMIKS